MNSSFLYCERQVSRLIVQMLLLHLPGLPVVSKHKLTKYGDEFVQDSHLFPFSPVQISHVVPLFIHNQDAMIHLTDTSRICIKIICYNGVILSHLHKCVKKCYKLEDLASFPTLISSAKMIQYPSETKFVTKVVYYYERI